MSDLARPRLAELFTHRGLEPLDGELVLQRDRQTMEGPHHSAVLFEIRVQFCSTFQSLVDEDLR